MKNPCANRVASLGTPGTDYLPVTPDGAIEMPEVAVALYVETGGRVSFFSVRGMTRTVELADKGCLLCGVRAVMATGTTATGLHAVVTG